jgi:hypothetical protein
MQSPPPYLLFRPQEIQYNVQPITCVVTEPFSAPFTVARGGILKYSDNYLFAVLQLYSTVLFSCSRGAILEQINCEVTELSSAPLRLLLLPEVAFLYTLCGNLCSYNCY